MVYCIIVGLYQVEKNILVDIVEQQMTYWIYQFNKKRHYWCMYIKNDKYLIKDIEFIESKMRLRFEKLACYEGLS